MNRHPDQARLKAFRGHRLSGAEFLQVARHLEECGECGEKSGSESGDLLAGLTSRDAGDHLSDDELDVLVDGRSDHETYASLSAHVRACRMCRAEVEDLRQFAESEASGDEAIRLAPVVAIGRRNWWLAAAAALVFLVALAALVPMLRVKTPAGIVETAPSAPATVSATPAAPRARVTIADHKQSISLLDDGSITGVQFRSAEDAAMARAALESQRIAIPAFITAMPSALRSGGADEGSGIRTIEPFRSAVLSRRPQFRWTPVSSATSYTVFVFDERYEEIARSEPLSGTSWTPSTALPAGDDLSWQVVAATPGGEVSSARAGGAEASFRILGDKESAEVGRAIAFYGDSSLLRGLFYARYGLLHDATREFRQLAEANPESPVAENLLRSVRGR